MAGLASSLSAVVLILCGAVNALLSKVVYQLEGQDCSGHTKPFQKPWLQTALMFIAMALCLPIAWGIEAWNNGKGHHHHQQSARRRKPVAASDEEQQRQPLLAYDDDNDSDNSNQQQQQQHHSSRFNIREALLLCIPTGFDLAATTLMNVGLLYVAASVFQILRGSEMVFAALFAVTFLKRPLNRWHYTGVGLCMVGMMLVGVSRVLAGGGDDDEVEQHQPLWGWSGLRTHQAEAGISKEHDTSNNNSNTPNMVHDAGGGGGAAGDPKMAALGMALIVLSQAIQAAQVTVEDHFMSDMHIHPLKIVGWEGVIGTVVMCGAALPVLQVLPYADGSGLAEDTRGSWCMTKSSPAIAVTLLLSSLAVLIYNISGMMVTEQVGAAARTVLENARTLIVWLAALVLYYTHVGGGNVGEVWDNWSWLQALGFAVFASGAFLYDKGHKVAEEADKQAGKTSQFSKWAVLKSTLGIHTGHFVGVKQFRAAADAVLAGVRAQRLARRDGDDRDGDGPSDLNQLTSHHLDLQSDDHDEHHQQQRDHDGVAGSGAATGAGTV